MEFQIHETINAPADQLWEIVGTNFNDISQWADTVVTSEANPNLEPGEKGRICEVKGSGTLVETITHYDDLGRELTFEIGSDSTPFFVKGVQSTWQIEPLDQHRSAVTVTANIKLLPLFNLVSGPLSNVFKKAGAGVLNDLKAYAEKDTISV